MSPFRAEICAAERTHPEPCGRCFHFSSVLFPFVLETGSPNAAQTDLQLVVIPLTQLPKRFPDSQGTTEVRPSTQLLLLLFKVLISFTRKKQSRVSFRLREEGGIWGTASAAFAVGFYLGEGAGKIQEGEAMVSAGEKSGCGREPVIAVLFTMLSL